MSNQKVFPVGKNSDFTGVQMASCECGFFIWTNYWYL